MEISRRGEALQLAQYDFLLRRFFQYCRLLEMDLMPRYDAVEHWAKIEVPHLDLEAARRRMQRRYPVKVFNEWRQLLDPKNILANDIIDKLFPLDGDEPALEA